MQELDEMYEAEERYNKQKEINKELVEENEKKEMSKEELKQEAEEKCVCTDEAMRIMYRIGYIDGAEPRERRIAELEKENAELKAGRPKWHKVVDGDLPKDENDVLVYSGEDWRMCVGRYSPKYKAWEAGCDPIAWCEIEPYKESE